MRVILVFQGGGVRGIAHIGALFEIAKRPDIEIEGVGGTSAGAIIAALFAAGYPPNELKTEVEKMFSPAENLLKPPFSRLASLFRSFGLYDTDSIIDRVRTLLRAKGKVHFPDLRMPCKIVGADLHERAPCVFSNDNSITEIADAVRMSISIPIFFKPYKYGERYYVDGGLVSNYPLWVFEHERSPIIGLRLEGRFDPAQDKLTTLFQFVGAVINTATSGADRSQRGFPKNAYTIPIDTRDIRSTDFKIGERDMELLFEKGRSAVRDFNWDQVVEPEQVYFRDPRSDSVLDKTVREIERVLSRSLKPQKRYRKYEWRFVIKVDGSCDDIRDFEIEALGEVPLNCVENYYNLDQSNAALSFQDLKIVAKDKDPSTDVSLVPSKNTEREKWVALYFLPPISPRQTRSITLSATVPGAFRKLIAFEEDNLDLELNSEGTIEECKVLLEIQREIGEIEVKALSGESSNFIRATIEQITVNGNRILGWQFNPMKRLLFSARIRRKAAVKA